MVWYSNFFKSFPQLVMIHTQSIRLWCNWWNRDSCFFLEFSNFLFDPTDVGNLISGSFSFSKHSLDIWKFLVYIMMRSVMQDFKHDLTSMGDECNYLMVVHSLVLPFLGIGMRIYLFQSCGRCWVFQVYWHIKCKTLMAWSFMVSNSSTLIPLHPLA